MRKQYIIAILFWLSLDLKLFGKVTCAKLMRISRKHTGFLAHDIHNRIKSTVVGSVAK